jgi:hypothetical protein
MRLVSLGARRLRGGFKLFGVRRGELGSQRRLGVSERLRVGRGDSRLVRWLFGLEPTKLAFGSARRSLRLFERRSVGRFELRTLFGGRRCNGRSRTRRRRRGRFLGISGGVALGSGQLLGEASGLVAQSRGVSLRRSGYLSLEVGRLLGGGGLQLLRGLHLLRVRGALLPQRSLVRAVPLEGPLGGVGGRLGVLGGQRGRVVSF